MKQTLQFNNGTMTITGGASMQSTKFHEDTKPSELRKIEADGVKLAKEEKAAAEKAAAEKAAAEKAAAEKAAAEKAAAEKAAAEKTSATKK